MEYENADRGSHKEHEWNYHKNVRKVNMRVNAFVWVCVNINLYYDRKNTGH